MPGELIRGNYHNLRYCQARRQSPGNFFAAAPEESKKPDENLTFPESVMLSRAKNLVFLPI